MDLQTGRDFVNNLGIHNQELTTNRNVLNDNMNPNNINKNAINNNNNNKNAKLSKTEKRIAIPEKLRKRLNARRASRNAWIIALLINFFLVIIAGFFFDCYYYTRDYIIDGEYFWTYYKNHNLSKKAVPLNAMLSGMICILTFGFNLMNYIVMGLFIIYGGVLERIKMASKFLI